MNCNCTTPAHKATCPNNTAYKTGLFLQLDGSFLVAYQNGLPLEPLDLTDAIQNGETNTRLQLDAAGEQLVYSNERSLSGDTSADIIPLESISRLIALSDLKDVAYDGVAGGALLAFNINSQKWEPATVNDDDLVSVIGYNAAGRLARADSAGVGGGGGGGGGVAERPTYSIATAESVLPDPTTYGQYSFTAMKTTLVIGNPGVASDGKTLVFRFRDDGTARALSWHANYRGIGVTIPGSTTGGFVYVGAKYNAQDNKWDVLAVNRQG